MVLSVAIRFRVIFRTSRTHYLETDAQTKTNTALADLQTMRNHLYPDLPRRPDEGMQQYSSNYDQKSVLLCRNLFFPDPSSLADKANIDKDKWIGVERQRWSQLFNVPMADRSPEPFPQSSLGCQRALTALTVSPQAEKLTDAIDEMFDTFW